MVVEWFIKQLLSLAAWFLDKMPDIEFPLEITSITAWMGAQIDNAFEFENVFPVRFAANVMLFLLFVWNVSVMWKVGMAVIRALTLGGFKI
jgi:hypothetical protein